MGRASSGKKVAKAARAGGGRARSAGERSLLYPLSLVVVVVLGTLLVVAARNDRQAVALEAPVPGEDHWHSAYGFYVCDSYLPELPEFEAATGIHTHGDGVIHIHPYSGAGGGDNATLGTFLEVAPDADIGDDSFEVGDTDYDSDFTCGDEPAEIRVLRWDEAATADTTEPTVITEDFDDIRFDADGEAYAIVAAPADAEIPPPPTFDDLVELGAIDGPPGVNDQDLNATTTSQVPEGIVEGSGGEAGETGEPGQSPDPGGPPEGTDAETPGP